MERDSKLKQMARRRSASPGIAYPSVVSLSEFDTPRVCKMCAVAWTLRIFANLANDDVE